MQLMSDKIKTVPEAPATTIPCWLFHGASYRPLPSVDKPAIEDGAARLTPNLVVTISRVNAGGIRKMERSKTKGAGLGTGRTFPSCQ